MDSLQCLISQDLDSKDQMHAKADAYCHVIEQLGKQAQNLREVSKSRLEYARSIEAQRNRLQKTLVNVLTTLNPGQTKFDLPEHRIASRRSEVVDVYDIDKVPDRFIKVEKSADKSGIKQAIKQGTFDPSQGAHLVPNTTWTIK